MTADGTRAEARAVRSSPPRGRIVAALLAGGIGTRFGEAQPKQVLTLAGTPVLAHVFRRFDAHPWVSELVIPAHPQWRPDIETIAHASIHETPWRLVDGGATRNDSVAAAVAAIDANGTDGEDIDGREAIVVVHDGARPLISEELISRTIDALEGADAVLPVIASTDPIVVVSDGDVDAFLDRARLRRGQTPQVFTLSILRAMFSVGAEVPPAAFSTLYELMLAVEPSARIRTVSGDERNLKITLPLDHLIAEQLLLGDDDAAADGTVVDFADTPGAEP